MSPPHPPLPIRMLTHNIRYATLHPFPGELLWPLRKPQLLRQLLYHTRHCPSSLICLQEVLHPQLLDILHALSHASTGPDGSADRGTEGKWSSIGVGRDDGHTAGEYSPILYRNDIWQVRKSFTRWLSPTPDVPGSKGWDAASVRIVTVGVLVQRGEGRRVVMAVNTHLDNQGAVSRREGAGMIVRLVREVMSGEEDGVEAGFLAGDLNSEVEGDAWRVLNERGSGLVDLRALVPEGGEGRYGEEMTYTGFDGNGDEDGRTKRIDFIHLTTTTTTTDIGSTENSHGAGGQVRPGETVGGSEAQWAVQGYAVLPNRFEDGVYISDHRAVVGDVLLM